MKKIAVFPGSFDPITNGHLKVLENAIKVFDEIVVLVMQNKEKTSNFKIEERLEMINKIIKVNKYKNVRADTSKGLTVQYATRIGAQFLIRGLRTVSDFEYEFLLESANKVVNPEIETIYFIADQDKVSISSSIVVQLYKNGVDVSKYIHPVILDYLKLLP